MQSLGADQIIDYTKDDFAERLERYDAVLDTIGGNVLEKSFHILKPGGVIVSVSGIPNARFGHEARLGKLKTMLLSLASYKLTALEKKTRTNYRFLFMRPDGTQLQTCGGTVGFLFFYGSSASCIKLPPSPKDNEG